MARGASTVDIERAPHDVFAVLCDVSKNHLWSSSSIEGRQTSAGPVGVGTTAHEVSRFMSRRIEVDSEIVAFVPDRLLAYETRGGPFPFRGTFEVEPLGPGTRLTAVFEATPTGMFRLIGPVFRTLVQRQLGADLGSLKRQLESGAL